GSSDWNIYAFNAVTGDKIWNYYAGDVLVVPTVAKGVVYAPLQGGANIYALDASNGVKIWNYSVWNGWNEGVSPFAIRNEVLYASYGGAGILYALNAISGAKIWNIAIGHEISAPTVVNDVIYLGSNSALYALNAHNGDILWNYTKGAGFGSPVVVDSVAYVGDFYDGEDNQVYAIAVPSPQLPEREPFPTMLVAIASIGLVAGISAGLLFYFKKRKH
ncbi:MAG: PQQ-like beta-propeller repeat protein, partial [Crenarchaeota archaeon]|nr:PQQ-like beta-propeller repeat protein [Thermoproteota archaeon]